MSLFFYWFEGDMNRSSTPSTAQALASTSSSRQQGGESSTVIREGRRGLEDDENSLALRELEDEGTTCNYTWNITNFKLKIDGTKNNRFDDNPSLVSPRFGLPGELLPYL
jgi:hypothetical protein